MKILIEFRRDGKSDRMEVDPSATINDVNVKIQERGVPPDQQILFLMDRSYRIEQAWLPTASKMVRLST